MTWEPCILSMKPVMHIGYEDVAVDRQGVTDMLKSPEVRKVINERGIMLITIAELTGKTL